MPEQRKALWVTLCLLNLSIVALFGFTLRSKILFSLLFINYRFVLSAHSHFAFAGWAGLALITFLIYELLPKEVAQRKKYQGILIGIEASALGMALTFPTMGYNTLSIILSSLYIFVTFYFAPVFLKDLLRRRLPKTVQLLSVSAIASLIISSIGPLGLLYIILTKSSNSILYRDSIYTFLHFQYNGFFTLAIFALFLQYVTTKGIELNRNARLFAATLCLSVLPSLALSLLWHNSAALYVIAAIGCVLMLVSLGYFILWWRQLPSHTLFSDPLARTLWLLSAFSFGLKLFLNVGTIFPALGHAVYGDRPVIIGFLHLVFLGFVTFYLLAVFIEHGYFKKWGKTVRYPFLVFGTGIIATEVLLMLQGLGNLLKMTASVFNWLLWVSSILLFVGAVLLAVVRFRISRQPLLHEKRP